MNRRRWLMVWVDFQRAFAREDADWWVPESGRALESTIRLQENLERILGPQGLCQLATRFAWPSKENGGKGWEDFRNTFNTTTDSDLELMFPAERVHAVVEAKGFSKWSAVRQRINLFPGCDEIVICGVATGCCVLSTALGAVDDGFRVHVISDCCADVTESQHRAACELLERSFFPNLRMWRNAEDFIKHNFPSDDDDDDEDDKALE